MQCSVCEKDICANCVVRADPGRARYWRIDRPAELSQTLFCPTCFDERIAPLYAQYDAMLATADDTYYFPKSYRGRAPVLRKSRCSLAAENLADKNAVLTQLQFDAVQQGFNGLVDVVIVGEKKRDEGYQKTIWRGTALPVELDRGKLERGIYD